MQNSEKIRSLASACQNDVTNLVCDLPQAHLRKIVPTRDSAENVIAKDFAAAFAKYLATFSLTTAWFICHPNFGLLFSFPRNFTTSICRKYLWQMYLVFRPNSLSSTQRCRTTKQIKWISHAWVWRSALRNWRMCQVQSHVTQKLGQMSKIGPAQI